MILRIKTSDFSNFSGFKYTDDSYNKNNKELNKYIKLFKENKDILYFQIGCENDTPIHLIAYIIEKVKEEYFIKIDHDIDNKSNKYWLCFYKNK